MSLSLWSTLTTLVVVDRGDNWIQDTSDNDNSTEGHAVAFEFAVVAVVVGREAVVEVTSAASVALVVANSRTAAVAVVVAAAVDDEPSKTMC